jgi:hypothetical protein
MCPKLAHRSEKRNLRWRDTSLALIWLPTDGPVVVAHTIADKRKMLWDATDADDVLAVRQVQYPTRQEVLVVDDRDSARKHCWRPRRWRWLDDAHAASAFSSEMYSSYA